MAGVRFEGVRKLFGEQPVVEGLDLAMADGEFLVLVGPSGCGKTTTLRMLAGLERPSFGRILIGDRVVNAVPPKDRDVAMVFQSYALYPHMTVRDNLAFGMRVRREPADHIARQIAEVSRLLGIDRLLERRPAALSGGERQRVAVGRAMLRHPQVFLMDEPLSNLDAALRVQMRAELNRLHARLGVTTLYVTHDQVEAMTLGDRIAVMRGGRLQQVDPPETLYENPANLFVAGFIGAPRMNIVAGVLRRAGDAVTVEALGARLPLELDAFDLSGVAGEAVMLGLRPEDLRWAREAPAGWQGGLAGAVELLEPLGSETYVTLRVGEASLLARFPPRSGLHPGDEVALAFDAARLQLFDADSERTLRRRVTHAPARSPRAAPALHRQDGR